MNKTIKSIIALAIIAAGVVFGLWFKDFRLDRADRKAVEAIREHYNILTTTKDDAALAEKMRGHLTVMQDAFGRCRERLRASLIDCMIDESFLCGDFAGAIEYVDQVSGRTQAWKDGVKAKLNAHAALAINDKATAIEGFLGFCKAVAGDMEFVVEVDPQTEVEWTKSMVLAHNYRRLSKLADEIGDKARSAEFLKEAKALAVKAVEEAEVNPEECRKILADLLD